MKILEHLRLRPPLYDAVIDSDSLDPELRKRIRDHALSCRRCREALEALSFVARWTTTPSPSGRLPEKFWSNFADTVEARLRRSERERWSIPAAVDDVLRDLFVFRRRSVALLASGTAIGIVAGLIFLHHEPPPGVADKVVVTVTKPASSPPIELARMQKYFRKSKTLLIGIENMRLDDGDGFDLSAEREASRELLSEARYLQRQPLDNRSVKLINDLEKILIELANIKELEGLPNVEIVRGGIHQKNLLFKIREAESMYDSTRFITINNKK